MKNKNEIGKQLFYPSFLLFLLQFVRTTSDLCVARTLAYNAENYHVHTSRRYDTIRYVTLHFSVAVRAALATVKLKFRHENIGVIYYTSYSHRDFSIQKTFLIKCYLLFFSVLWSLAILMLLLLPPFLFLPMFRWCLVHGLKKRLRKKIEEAKRIGNHNRAQADRGIFGVYVPPLTLDCMKRKRKKNFLKKMCGELCESWHIIVISAINYSLVFFEYF